MSGKRDSRDIETFGIELTPANLTRCQLRDAALVIAGNALDANDCRMLLETCGLASPGGDRS